MPQPPEVEAAAEELIRVYRQAWETIVREQVRVFSDPRRAGRRQRLSELRAAVERELARLEAPTRRWLQERLPAIYQAGAEVGWSALHTQAVQQLATDTFSDLLKATRYVGQDMKRLIREASKLFAELTLTTGETAVASGRGLAELLARRGLAAIVYRNGARHGLADYSDMVLRTKTAVAYNTGTINAATERGFDVFEIFDGPGCGLSAHGVGPEADGMIVSAEEARAFPIAHPRCQRAFSARPDLSRQSPERTRVPVSLAPALAGAATAVVQRQPRQERQARQPRQPRRQRVAEPL